MLRFRTIARSLADRVNPIVVKELRQAVQSRLVISILFLFLAANVAIVSIYLMTHEQLGGNRMDGESLFMTLFGVLVFTCMVFVPLYAGIRLTTERNDANIDLLFITTIRPGAIIRGKFSAAVALTVLIYSTCMPFLTFTYLLRGIDLPSIFFALGTALALTAAVTMLAIFAGSVSAGWLIRLLLGGGLLFIMYRTFVQTMEFCEYTVRSGLATLFGEPEAWARIGLIILMGLTAVGLLYLLAVAAISSKSSNRMFGIRLYATVVWFLYGVVLTIWSSVDATSGPITVWMENSVWLFSAALVFIMSERERWTPRVRRRIPRGGLMRFLAWLMYTGSAGGAIWCAVIVAGTLVVGLAASSGAADFAATSFGGYRQPPAAMLLVLPGIFLYAWCYSMAGLFARRIFAPNSPPLATPIISIGLLAAGCTLPILLAYLVIGSSWNPRNDYFSFMLPNPAVLNWNHSGDRTAVYIFLITWATIGFAVNITWFRKQWDAFRRHEPKPVAPLAEEPSPQPQDAPLLLAPNAPPTQA